ncbi:MAG: PorV/PorQ family protein [Elusimicrobiota bacterium]
MRRLLTAAAALCLAGTAGAARYAGGDPFEFLFLDAGALPASLGGAFAAVGDNADSLAYNPAGLGFMDGSHASFLHNAHFQGVSRQRLAFAHDSGWALGADRLSYGDVRRTTLSNPTGAGLDDFTPSAAAFSAGFGTCFLDEGLALGIAAKHIRETLDSVRTAAWAADAGMQLRFEDPTLLLGMSVRNMGPKVKTIAKPEPLPLDVALGAATRLRALGFPLGLLLDVDKVPQGRVTAHFGMDFEAMPGVALRLGYNARNDAGLGLTAGFGLAMKAFTMDYAIVPYGALGYSHLISLGVRWGKEPEKAARQMYRPVYPAYPE